MNLPNNNDVVPAAASGALQPAAPQLSSLASLGNEIRPALVQCTVANNCSSSNGNISIYILYIYTVYIQTRAWRVVYKRRSKETKLQSSSTQHKTVSVLRSKVKTRDWMLLSKPNSTLSHKLSHKTSLSDVRALRHSHIQKTVTQKKQADNAFLKQHNLTKYCYWKKALLGNYQSTVVFFKRQHLLQVTFMAPRLIFWAKTEYTKHWHRDPIRYVLAIG